VIRLAWRQFRTEAIIGIGALVIVAVVLAITGPHLLSVYRTAPDQLTSTYHSLQTAVGALLVIVPALAGIFFGAPLIARELETGTFRLAWTQSVTRGRWLVVKLALVGLASSVFAGGFSLMAAWWANPIDITNKTRFDPAAFGMFGIVPFSYALFAFALGATAGLLLRKTLPAMATALAGYVGVRYAVTYLVRPHFEAPLHANWVLSLANSLTSGEGFNMSRTSAGLSLTAQAPNIPNGWGLSGEIVDKSGQAPSSAFLNHACPTFGGPVQSVHRIAGGPHTRPLPQGTFQSCIAAVGTKFHLAVTYQPANRYWPFQIYETVLFVVLALGLTGLSLWWVRRRLT
jgi:hypothetical protein